MKLCLVMHISPELDCNDLEDIGAKLVDAILEEPSPILAVSYEVMEE